MLILMYCDLFPHSPSQQTSPSITAMATCVEEAEVRAATRMWPQSKYLAIVTRANQQYSEMACYMYINGHAFFNICITIHTMCHQTQQCCSSLAQDLTAKPLTVSLIFCPMLSCRVSGMSRICFSTWHASSPCIMYLLARGFARGTLP